MIRRLVVAAGLTAALAIAPSGGAAAAPAAGGSAANVGQAQPQAQLPARAQVLAERRDSVRSAQWYLSSLKIAEAHQKTQGTGVTVAVVDTGVDASHPDLTGNVDPGASASDAKSDGRKDRSGHGTSVASVIAGHGHGAGGNDGVLGIAPKAHIVPVDVSQPGSDLLVPATIGLGIRRAVTLGADVICVAISGGYAQEQVDAIEYAKARNVLVVAGVGNRPEFATIGNPALIDDAVAVGATGKDGQLTPQSLTGEALDITAPGAAIEAATVGHGYGSFNGTSMSTAVACGVLALIRAAYPKATAIEQLKRLLWTATDKGAAGPDAEFGFGVVNPVGALTGEPVDPRLPQDPSSTAAHSPSATVVAEPENDSLRGLPWALVGGAVVVVLVVIGLALIARSRRR